MKQSINLKLSTQVRMTPQLQHAIKLLQMSTLDLQQEIQENLDNNPLLEIEDNQPHESISKENLETIEDNRAILDLSFEQEHLAKNSKATDLEDNHVTEKLETPLSEDLPLDTTWEDTFQHNQTSLKERNENFNNQDFIANNSTEETLQDHLIWQLNLVPLAKEDKILALSLIDSIDSNGFLNQTLEELLEAINLEETNEQTSIEILEDILNTLQKFDPAGVAARDLSECLMLQLRELEILETVKDCCTEVINCHLEQLASKDLDKLRKNLGVSESLLNQALLIIKSLNPKPGSVFSPSQTDYIYPDVIAKKESTKWIVELNADTLPKVRINSFYENFSRTSIDKADKAYLKEHLQDAKWFLKSLQTRHDTLLKVASQIVEVQKDFLDHGPEYMKPLVLSDVAQRTELHESTISRITNKKYIATPRGVFELKYFFSSHLGTASGGEISSTAIRALIQKLVTEEPTNKPLSDSKIVNILLERDVKIARRTVAKYRESLGIASSSERKKL
ncbi:RNA polymerase factor sigma-54 [Gammaproteobacteria bacterium]|nr:RNA polymerase factor sigma-54 [Gammaproteobacteria bacterium]